MSQTKAELIQTVKQGTVSLGDADSSHSIKLKAPATVAADRTWTMPAVDPTANQVLRGNASTPTTLEWGTVSSTPEGTSILSTGESGASKYLREDGDGSCSWQAVSAAVGSDAAQNTVAGDNAGNAGTWSGLGGNNCFGENAGTDLTTGTYNHCFGYQAGSSITSGNYNIAIGFEALKTTTTGGGNIAIGQKAMNGGDITGANNTAVGLEALKGISGNVNGCTAVGYRAGYSASTTDGQVTAFGYEACKTVSSGIRNCGIGYQALLLTTTGGHEYRPWL
jgi:hypothetical protein